MLAKLLVFLLQCFRFVCSIDIPANGAATGMSEQEQMAWLANAVYKFRTPIAGWELAEQLQLQSCAAGETDNFAIYRHAAANECVLAIAGTDSATDMLDNFDGRAVADCGFPDIHSGYMSEVNDLLKACHFQTNFVPLLNSSNCSGGITVTGHSLGGGVASVFAACANNPAKPFTFHVNKLWTFGAPAVSSHPLHNGIATDGCFAGGRIWNQDTLTIDPIPGLSRGLNFFHPRLEATRLYEKASVSGTKSYDATSQSCGTWQSYEKPNPTDGVPYPILHLMTAYAARTRDKYTGAAFTSPTVPPTATAAPINLLSCRMTINYTYTLLSVYSADRTGFDGWGHTTAGYGSSYALALACFLGAAWGFRSMKLTLLARESVREYYDEHNLKEFFDESMAELDKAKPEDPLEWLEEFVRRRRQDTMAARNSVSSASKSQVVLSPMLMIGRCCRCKRKHKSNRRRRSPHVQFFIFLILQGSSMFFAAIARHLLDMYDQNGETMGRHWYDPNAAWMLPWTVGVTLAPSASMTAFALVLSCLSYPDWTVHTGHVVGLMAAVLELQLMWTENLSNTGIVSSYVGAAASFIAMIELAVHLCKRRMFPLTAVMAPITVIILLCIGVMLMFIGYVILAAATTSFLTCDFPNGIHSSECPFPESFNANAVCNSLLTCGVLSIIAAMSIKIRANQKIQPRGEDCIHVVPPSPKGEMEPSLVRVVPAPTLQEASDESKA